MHLTTEQLEAGVAHVAESPRDSGGLELIVCRPAKGERRVLAEGTLDLERGLIGDMWRDRKSSSTPDRQPDPDRQITLMNARAVALIVGEPERWPLAGDQFYVDLDLSVTNLPAGSRLQLGTAVVEITAQPHTGCAQFSERFGRDALRFVNSPAGRELRLRGANARVIVPGTVAVGSAVAKLAADAVGAGAPVE